MFRGLLVASIALTLPVLLLLALPIVGGDTLPLIWSARTLVECAKTSDWTTCEGAQHYGLLQHLFAMALVWGGLGDKSALRALTAINLVVYVGLIAAIWRSSGLSTLARRVGLLVFVIGPPIAYAVYSFGEMLALAFGCLLLLALADRRHPGLVFTLALLSCMARESAALAVLPLAAAVIIGRPHPTGRERRTVIRQDWLPFLLGLLAGVALDVAFNLWRFGGVSNPVYDDPIYRTPGILLKLNGAASVWLAPGGGALPFWFAGAIAAIAIPICALRGPDRRRRIAASLVLGALALQTLILSMWWSPFGWYAWGPRLLLPTLAMAVMATLIVFPDELQRALHGPWRRSLVAPIAGLLILVSATATVGFVASSTRVQNWFYEPHGQDCPVFPDFNADRAHYYDCVYGTMMWNPRGSLWATSAREVASWKGVYGMVFVLAVWRIGAGRWVLGSAHRFAEDDVDVSTQSAGSTHHSVR
jgi:hypothetical protein